MNKINNIQPLNKIADLIRGISFKRKEGLSEPLKDHFPIIRAGNIQDSLNLDKDLIWVPKEKVSNNQLIKYNDIIMCTSSGSPHIVEKCAKANMNWKGSLGAFCVGIRSKKDRCDADYLYYYLKSPAFTNWSQKSSGANIKNIRKSELENFPITLPPLKEQRRIASILDKADAIRRKRQESIKLADEFLKSVFLDMFGDPVMNLMGWPEGTIRELVNEVNYGTSKKSDKEKGKYPILRMNNITYNGFIDLNDLKYIDLNENEQSKYFVNKNDLLFNRTNSKELVGKTAVFDIDKKMAFAGYLIRLKTNEKSNPHYISGYLNSKHGKLTLMNMCKKITGVSNINAQELQNIKILIPPKELQDKYSTLVKKIMKKKQILKSYLNLVDDLFNSLTQRAFKGEL